MTDENFTIDVDHGRRLLRVASRGHWQLDTVDRDRDAMCRTLQTMATRYPLESAVILLDTRALPIQSRDVTDYYSRFPISCGPRPRRIAILATSRLVGMQIRRIGLGDQPIYEDEAEALAWLLEA